MRKRRSNSNNPRRSRGARSREHSVSSELILYASEDAQAIYAERELLAEATCKEHLQVREEGKRKVKHALEHYNLDVVLAVGYRAVRIEGRIALNFIREAASAKPAIISALTDVKRVIPHARLLEVTPDFVGLSDVAELLGVSRQNMRKLMVTHPLSFPAPLHEGSAAIWHLTVLLEWVITRAGYQVHQRLRDVAHVAMQINLTKESDLLEEPVRRGVKALVV